MFKFWAKLFCYSLIFFLASSHANTSIKPFYIGVKVLQISNIDQKSENFTAVIEYASSWNEPAVQFKDKNKKYQTYSIDQLKSIFLEKKLNYPQAILYNQQGRVDQQRSSAIIKNDGTVIVYRRLTTTFQAPEFDFLKYPFDQQNIFIHIDSLFPNNEYVIKPLKDFTKLGDKLGEEEWILKSEGIKISEHQSSLGFKNSRFSFEISMKRHLSYYIFKVFIPLIVIILVSWFAFFLNDYVKRIDIAAGNLLLFIAYNFSISSELPRLGYLTFMDICLMITFLISGITVLTNVAFRRLENKGYRNRLIIFDKIILWAYPFLYFIGFFIVYFIYFI